MFSGTVDLTQSGDQREALRQSLIGYSALRDVGREDEIGDVTYVHSDPDISRLIEGKAELKKPHEGDPHIRLLLQCLRDEGWVF